MADTTTLLISLGATLLASAIPQILYWKNSRETDPKKRRWQLDDVLREKEIQVLEGRIVEINKLANAMTKSFHEKRLSYIQFLAIPDEEKSSRLTEFFSNSITNIAELQREFYATTPMILSLGLKTGKLVKLWEEVTEIDEDLIHLINEQTRNEIWEELNRNEIIKTLDVLKKEFNITMSKFYSEIDEFLVNEVNDQVRYASYD